VSTQDTRLDRHRTEILEENVLFLLETGQHPELVAKQVGVTPGYIEEMLRKQRRRAESDS
jgi:hypothetical protein